MRTIVTTTGTVPAPAPLPKPLTTFVGRAREIEAVVGLLQRDDARLLTLTGIGGVGKSRLALEAAQRAAGFFAAGIWHVDLGTVLSPEQVMPAVAQALGVSVGLHETTADRIAQAFGSVHGLLVLDNAEALAGASREPVALLVDCPHLHILVTTRSRLAVYGEVTYAVPPLQIEHSPDCSELEQLECVDAIELFVARARNVIPTFSLTDENAASIAQICRRLDGLPLAIEFAAARVDLIPVEAMASRLERRLGLPAAPSRDPSNRAKTIRDALEWSHELLDPEVQAAFRRLAVFSGSFDLDAAEWVIGPDVLDGLTTLADASLLAPATGRHANLRFSMLETVRAYALELLEESGELDAYFSRHADYLLNLVKQAESGLAGAEQVAWLDRLETEHDNVRLVLRWAIERRMGETALRLTGALGPFWAWHGHLVEGAGWLDQALQMASSPTPVDRAKALHRRASLAIYLGDYGTAAGFLETALAAYQESDDRLGMASALTGLGIVAADRADLASADAWHRQALEIRRALGDRPGEGLSLFNLGTVAAASGNFSDARMWHSAALAIRQELGALEGVAYSRLALGEVSVDEPEEVRELYIERAMTLFQESGDRSGLGYALMGKAQVALDSGKPGDAARHLGDALSTQLALQDRPAVMTCLERLARIASATGHPAEAARFLGAAASGRATLGTPPTPIDAGHIEQTSTQAERAIGTASFALERSAGQMESLTSIVSTATALARKIGSHLAEADSGGGTGFDLTPREREVLHLLVEGKSDREIAAELFMAPRTVSWHVGHILAKLEAESRTAAAATALRNGIV